MDSNSAELLQIEFSAFQTTKLVSSWLPDSFAEEEARQSKVELYTKNQKTLKLLRSKIVSKQKAQEEKLEKSQESLKVHKRKKIKKVGLEKYL
jgi:hypothetical protein